MHIFICGDDVNGNMQIIQYLKTYFNQTNSKSPKIAVFHSGKELFENVRQLYAAEDIKIPLETRQGVFSVLAQDIILVETLNRKVIVHTVSEDYELLHSMNYWFRQLQGIDCFFQTHRSYIINMKHVDSFNHSLIWLCNNRYVAYLTRRKYQVFKAVYLSYLGYAQ